MEEKNVNMVIKLSIVVAVLLSSFSVFYYFVIFLPQKEKEKMQLQQQEMQTKENRRSYNNLMLEACLQDTYSNYTANWNSNCKVSGLNHHGDGCSLPSYLAESLNRGNAQAREECYKRYPAQ